MGRYVVLSEDSFFIKRFLVDKGPASKLHITTAEKTFAEEWADDHVDECLGKIFSSLTGDPPTPNTIREIAIDLASHKVRLMVLAGNAPNEDEHTDGLLEKAKKLLLDIVEGRCGIKNRDGTFDPKFPGPARLAVEEQVADVRFFTQLNRPFETMDHVTPTENPESDEFSDPNYIEDGVGHHH